MDFLTHSKLTRLPSSFTAPGGVVCPFDILTNHNRPYQPITLTCINADSRTSLFGLKS